MEFILTQPAPAPRPSNCYLDMTNYLLTRYENLQICRGIFIAESVFAGIFFIYLAAYTYRNRLTTKSFFTKTMLALLYAGIVV